MDFLALLGALALPLVRGVLGWAQNAFADGRIEWPEWKRLAKTVVELGTPIVLVYAAVEVTDVNSVITVVSAGVLSLMDWFKSYTKK